MVGVSALVYAFGGDEDIPLGVALLKIFVALSVAIIFFSLAWFLAREGFDTGAPEELHLTEAAVVTRERGPRSPREIELLEGIKREVAAAPSPEEVAEALAGGGGATTELANPKLTPVAFAVRSPSASHLAKGRAMDVALATAFLILLKAFPLLLPLLVGFYTWPIVKRYFSKAITLTRRARQYRLDPREILLRETRDPILYLRAFSEDYGGDLVGFWQTTPEERLTRYYKKWGPVLAVGDPHEDMPMLGAVRLYFDDSTWRPGILYLMSVSQLVVIQAGFAPGLLWELGVARRRVEPGKLVVSFAAWEGLDEWQRQTYYLRFKNYAEELMGCELPPEINAPNYITFEQDWTPVLKLDATSTFESPDLFSHRRAQ